MNTTEMLAYIEKEIKPFTKRHLEELAIEYLEWQESAVLEDGRMRELARMLEPIVGSHHQCLAVAQSYMTRAMAEYIAWTTCARKNS